MKNPREVTLGYKPLGSRTKEENPKILIVRWISMLHDDRGNSEYLDINYLNDSDKPIPVPKMKLTDIMKSVWKNGPPAPFVRASSPLDLNCKEDSFIIFALDPRWNWQFNPKGDCLLMEGKHDDGKYSEALFLKKDGQVVAGGNVGDGCMLLCFKADCSAPPHFNDKFNLMVEILLDPIEGQNERRRTQIIIDPDVKFPGGSGD